MIQSVIPPLLLSDAGDRALLAGDPLPTTERLSQTIIQLESPLRLVSEPELATSPALEALQRLVTLLQTLQSPAQGWTTARGSASDLLPYVSEEAYEVFDAIAATSPTAPDFVLPVCLPLDTLMTQLLWGVARSAYPVMRLIEGVRGRCWLEDTEQVGMLRLLVLLETSVSGSVDLVMRRSPTAWLSDAAVIEFESDFWCPPLEDAALPTAQALRVANWLSGLQHAVQIATPTLQPYLQGLTANLLAPTAEWRSTELRLKLALEFVAESGIDAALPDRAFTSRNGAMSGAIETAASSPVAAPKTLISPISVRLGDHPALKEGSPRLLPHLHYWLQQLGAQRHCPEGSMESSSESPSERSLLPIVTVATAAAHHFTHWNLTRQPLSLSASEGVLEELLPRMLWQVSRGSYEVMRLLGGIEARVLQPRSPWQTGLLRWVGRLKLVSPDQEWTFDLARGPVSGKPLEALPPDAIVQAAGSFNCQQPIPVATLAATLTQAMYQSAPDLKQLSLGVALEWQVADHAWRSGMLWLSFELEFTSAPCGEADEA